MLISLRALGGVLLLACSLASSFAQSSFTGLGFLPGGSESRATAVSSDGKVVVGYGGSASGLQAFRWTTVDGMVGLGYMAGGTNYSMALAVSSNGSVLVGWNLFGSSDGGAVAEAFRWTATGGMVGLGDLPGEGTNSIATGVSGDGSTVVGRASAQAFRWTARSGMVGLGYLHGGQKESCADAISSDGKVIVGHSGSTLGSQVFRWTAASGMTGLGYLPGSTNSYARAVSSDGSVVVGFSSGSVLAGQTFYWTASGGMVALSKQIAGCPTNSFVLSMCSDGPLIVSESHLERDEGMFIWDRVNGMRNLKVVLTTDFMLKLTGWTTIWATGISPDRKTIIGEGLHNGNIEAWVARLDRPVNEAGGKKAKGK
jgi:probable HAF family extracellular repeat protein